MHVATGTEVQIRDVEKTGATGSLSGCAIIGVSFRGVSLEDSLPPGY